MSESLIFRLLVTAKGFNPSFADSVDPLREAVEIRLRRADAPDRRRQISGRVVDPIGRPVRGATVTAIGWHTKERSVFGVLPLLAPIAITNDRGRFVLTTRQVGSGADQYLIKIRARGLAPRIFDGVRVGKQTTLRLNYGVSVRGRLLHHGEPLSGVLVGLVQANRSAASFLGEETIGTDSEGQFAFTNVAASDSYLVYGKMSSLARVGAVEARGIRVGLEGSTQNVEPMEVSQGHQLRGRVVVAGGGVPPPGGRVLVARWGAWDFVVSPLDSSGQFEATGIPAESVEVAIRVPGLRLSPANRIPIDPGGLHFKPFILDHDIDDLEAVLEPVPRTQGQKGGSRHD